MAGFYGTIAHYYDAENTDKTDDIDFYREMVQEYDGPILDVGCGTGRVMFPLAQMGYEVHGIDNEKAMLDIAKERMEDYDNATQNRLHFHYGDVTDYDMPVKFKLTTAPYNAMMHFHDQETQLKVLDNLRAWTADDGVLILDLPNAGDVFASQDSDSMMYERTFIDSRTGHMVMQQSLSYLDRTSQLLRVTWVYDEITGDGTVKRTFAPLVLYYYFYNEMRLLLERANFEVVEVYGDTDYSPYEEGCERMIIIAKPV